MACEPHKNPLQRSGTSQLERRLPGLSPDFIRIDERRYGDWIVFAAEFSKWLRFYDSASGASLKGWQAFFARDVSAVLGGFAVQDIETWRVELRERLDFLRDDDHAGQDAALRKQLGEAISAVVTLAKALDDFHLQLAEDIEFKSTLRKFIKGKLGPAFRRLLAYFKAAKALGLYQAVTDHSWKILNRPLTDADVILADTAAFTLEWWDPANGINSFADIAADGSVFGDPGSVYARLSHAANHFLFSSTFDQFTEAYARLIADAETALAGTLEGMDNHKPHYALFLTFLKLFRTSQSRLNDLTWRHLDHYYKDILRLRPKAPEPNHVHLVAELAKSVSAASLPQGARFRAGKDSLGKDVFYALDRETTFNKAEIAEFKAVYKVDPTDTWQDASLKNSKRLFAAPMMNSADGAGAELLTPFKEWHPFLNRSVAPDGKITAVNMPPARIGFALASHYLFLAEGSRTIRLRLGGDLFGTFPKEKLVCYLTHEKGWLEKSPENIIGAAFTAGGSCTEIEIRLTGTDPAITAWNAKVHGGAYNLDVPVVQCILRNDPGEVYGLDELKNISITSAEVHVGVGTNTGSHDQTGAKQIFLANANGALDPSKPFMPWGAVPQKDAPLILGSKELFSKKNAAFNVHIEWANRPGTVKPSPGAKLQFLEGGVWEDSGANLTDGEVSSSTRQRTFTSDITVPEESLVDYQDPYPGLTPASRAGFMRLLLTGNFGQEAFAASQLAALITGAGGTPAPMVFENLESALMGNLDEVASAVEDAVLFKDDSAAKFGSDKFAVVSKGKTKPYLPMISAVYLSYTAGTRSVNLASLDEDAFANRPVRLFHVGPFGEAEQDFPIPGSSGHFLLPQFRLPDSPDHVGEWQIGIRNLSPRQSVDILFQVLEGSTLPTLSKPENHVTWSYWAGNRWIPFEDRDVSDATNQLIQSGIIRFTIPHDATTDKGIMPPGFIWVMASVKEAVGAVCKVLSAHAQAMQATFADNGNAPDFLDQVLPAGTISKLKDADARFKKFAQPYPAFGGRKTESSGKFYLRSSERLRHKGRAVTIWDYETMVLEAFPSLYKVKCLNHTRIEDNPNAALAIHNENQPGHVALIAIPNLVNRNDANPLKPYAAQDLLSGIKDYLRERVTGQLVPGPEAPFQVNVHVCNPLFEEIYLEFELQLMEGYDDFTWYRQVLQEEITRFLSPWAFSPPVSAPSANANSADVEFGGRISKSALINFIEERPYVDFITEVVLKHKPENKPVSGDLEEAVATTSRSILVSAPAADHAIKQYGT